jgi:hypothetical protein
MRALQPIPKVTLSSHSRTANRSWPSGAQVEAINLRHPHVVLGLHLVSEYEMGGGELAAQCVTG